MYTLHHEAHGKVTASPLPLSEEGLLCWWLRKSTKNPSLPSIIVRKIHCIELRWKDKEKIFERRYDVDKWGVTGHISIWKKKKKKKLYLNCLANSHLSFKYFSTFVWLTCEKEPLESSIRQRQMPSYKSSEHKKCIVGDNFGLYLWLLVTMKVGPCYPWLSISSKYYTYSVQWSIIESSNCLFLGTG